MTCTSLYHKQHLCTFVNLWTFVHRRLQAWACPGIARVILKHCVLISQGLDVKTRSMPSDQHKRAYTRTDVRIALQCSDNMLPQLCIKCGVAKFCPGTHSALQAPMLLLEECTTLWLELSLRKLCGSV